MLSDKLEKPTDSGDIQPPCSVSSDAWQALNDFGGFPEPFSKAERRFYTRWSRLRTQQLVREDVRDLTRVQDIAQLEQMAQVLLS